MGDEKGFYTLKGYQIKDSAAAPALGRMTTSMEDYLEMMCRMQEEEEVVRISALAEKLHVKPSSASKMAANLMAAGLVEFRKYGYVTITPSGREAGAYLLHRHQVLHDFLCLLNGTENELEQVEKIEHFIKPETIANLEVLTARLARGKA